MTVLDRKAAPAAMDGNGTIADAVYRHRISTRLWHWVNAATIVIMLMSGLMIFNAHPRLYWGSYGANRDHPWLEIGSHGNDGYLRVGPLTVTTTGVLGVWRDTAGNMQYDAFPGWATLPSSYDLARARRWHLTFAWILAFGIAGYGLWSLANGHLRRDLLARTRGNPPDPRLDRHQASRQAALSPPARRQDTTTSCRRLPIWGFCWG